MEEEKSDVVGLPFIIIGLVAVVMFCGLSFYAGKTMQREETKFNIMMVGEFTFNNVGYECSVKN